MRPANIVSGEDSSSTFTPSSTRVSYPPSRQGLIDLNHFFACRPAIIMRVSLSMARSGFADFG
jgi:hypothetical protein